MHMHACVGCTHQNETNKVFAQFESLCVCIHVAMHPIWNCLSNSFVWTQTKTNTQTHYMIHVILFLYTASPP